MKKKTEKSGENEKKNGQNRLEKQFNSNSNVHRHLIKNFEIFRFNQK